MPKKYFTPAEANRTLPLVKRIVNDILETGQKVIKMAPQLDNPHDPLFQKYKRELEGYFAELQEIGCDFKDWSYEVGLVDFPAVLEGEDVMLCWRSDEDELMYYHGLHEGYRGRKRIPPEYFDE